MGWTYTALTEKSEAKLIEITTDDGSLVFVNGTSSSSKTLSIIEEGFTPYSFKWEKKNSDGTYTQVGTARTYIVAGVANVGTYRATAYEDANDNVGHSDMVTIASVSDGQGGSSPYLFSLSNENFTINTTNDLKPTTSLSYEVKVTGYHGSSVMTAIASGTPTAEQFKIIIPTGSIFSLQTGTTDTLVYAANTSTELSSENLAETITIAYDTNKSETKTITVSCAKNGISPTVTQGPGSVTITDASGHTGTVSDGHSPSVTATKDNGVTYVNVDGTQIATISDGATGKNALQPNRNWTSTYTTISQTETCNTTDFNRTPVVGDTFTNLDGSSNTGTWQVTAISGTTVTIKLLSFVNSKGAKGDTGENAIVMTSASTPSGTYNGQVGIWQGQIYIWNGTQWENQTNILPTDAVLHYSFDDLPDYPDGANIYYKNRDWTIVDWDNFGGHGTITVENGILVNSGVNDYLAFQKSGISIGAGAICKLKLVSTIDANVLIYGFQNDYIYIKTINLSANTPLEDIFSIGFNTDILLLRTYYASTTLAELKLIAIYIGDGSYSTPVIDNANGKWNSVSQSGFAVQGVSGKGVKCFANKYIGIGNFNLNTNFSISIWVNPENNTSGLNGNIITKEGQFILRNGAAWGNYLMLYVYNDTSSAEALRLGNALTPNQWTNIIIVKNEHSLMAYINGVLVYNTTRESSIVAQNNNWYFINSDSNNRIQSYDDLLIFDRALTEKEVLALYYNKANTPQFYTKADYDLAVRKYQYLGRTLYVPTSNSVTVYTSTTVINGTSVSKTAQNGDFVSVMYSGSSGTTPLGKVYKFNGQSWELDSDTGHEIEAMADILMLADSLPSNGTTDLFLSRLVATNAFIERLFAKTITIQHDSSNTGVIQSSNYVADTSGFKMTGEGVAEFNGNIKVNNTNIYGKRECFIVGRNNADIIINGQNVQSNNGLDCIFIGEEIGKSLLDGSQYTHGNIFMGSRVAYTATTAACCIGLGGYNFYNGNPKNSIALGLNALRSCSGSNNIGIGYLAGYNYSSMTGSNNVFIGENVGKGFATGSNNVIIGSYTDGAYSNQSNLTLINNAIEHILGNLYSANSSGTFKKVITEEDILTSKTAINTGALKSLLNVSEIYLRAMAVDSASGTTSQAYSKACSSYITFSNGLKIQWGVIKAGASRKDMYFPISFSGNNTYTLFLTNREPNNSGTDTGGWDYTTSINSKTASTANISIPNGNNPFEWIAIGY